MKKRHRGLRTKLQIPIITVMIIVFGLSISIVAVKMHRDSIKDAKTIINTTAREYAIKISTILERDLSISRTFAQTLVGYLETHNPNFIDLTLLTLKKSIEKNSEIYSTWVSFPLDIIDVSWKKDFGRRRITVFKDKNKIDSNDEMLDLTGDNKTGIYYLTKINKEEIITDPYPFSYGENQNETILETSICVPMLINNKFVGLAGVDISLERFNKIVDSIKPFTGAEAMLLSNNGQIIAFSDRNYIGKFYNELNQADNVSFNIMDNVKRNAIFSYETTLSDKKFYISHVPVHVGESHSSWSLQIAVPLDIIINKSVNNVKLSVIIAIIGIFLLIIVVSYITHSIILPIHHTTGALRIISEGDLKKVGRLNINTGDELEAMSNSLNILIDSLKQTSLFAKEIGKGKLDIEYKLLSDNDEIGLSLIEMQQSLKKAANEDKIRRIEDEKQNWISRGIAIFGDILRQDNINVEELSFSIITNLVNYINVQQGCIYIINDKDSQNSEDIYFEMKAAVAFDRRKLMRDKVYIGEGIVGRCAHEKLTIYMIEVPENYVHINSGLGEANPGSILLVPLLLNQQVFGVIELVSFKPIEQHSIVFVEKIAESIAGTLSNAKINEKTKTLLTESQKQREELASQEEEMRQNLEELQATQEDASRREAEMRSIWKVFSHIALIIEYDTDFNVISVNDKSQEFFGDVAENLLNMPHQALGFIEDRDSVNHVAFIQRIKRGVIVQRRSNLVTRFTNKWLQETYAPLYDHDGNITRFVSVGVDISALVELEKQNK